MKASHKIVAVLAGAALPVMLLAVAALMTIKQTDTAEEAVTHGHQLIIGANMLVQKLVDAETAERGYVLTGDEAFLKPYLAVRNSIPGHLEQLRQQVSRDISRKHLDAVAPSVEGELTRLSSIIELRRSGQATAAINNVATGEGNELMDGIRSGINSFVQVEQSILDQHTARLRSNLEQLFIVLAIVCVLVFLLVPVVAYLIYRESQHRLKDFIYLKTQHLLKLQKETNAKLRRANRAKTEFLSNMSHELRTPLNAILGFAQLMESDPTPPTPTQKESTNQILQAGWYLLDLINEVLDLTLIDSGRLLLSQEALALDEILVECQAMVELPARQHRITLNFPHFDQACFVHADRTRVKQVLINLLTNAIKYNHPGGVVAVDCTEPQPGCIRISIRDSGPGLAPEDVAQLFQPFNRLGQEASRTEGTGIGLVMAKRLVELMGGSIGVESTVGEGSMFWIELERASEPQLGVDAGAALAGPLTVLKGAAVRTVLCIEDNPANLKLVEQLISRRPAIRMLGASSATLGIKLAHIHQPQVILMDINLPEISGLRALQILRDDPLTRRIPVIAISANAMPGDIRRGLEAGFFRYLAKPLKVDQFMEALDVALKFAQTKLAGVNADVNKRIEA